MNHDIYIDQMKEFRNILVAARRQVIATALDLKKHNGPDDPTYGTQWAEDIRRVQEQLAAVDQAIADERKLRPSVYETGERENL